jgi:large subunit ribosomal protein L25
MHTEIEFTIAVKTGCGKGAARKVRQGGRVPGIVYGSKMDPLMISFEERDLVKALSTRAGRNVFLRMKSEDKTLDGERALIKDLQVHPLLRRFTHMDLYKIDPTKEIHATVPILVEGIAIGVKLGGILQIARRELTVVCLPDNLPDAITVDVTNLTPGHSIHVGDIPAPEGVRILTGAKLAVCAVISPSAEVTEAKPAEGEVAEGEAAEGGSAEGEAAEKPEKKEKEKK